MTEAGAAPALAASAPCPCDTGLAYGRCCGRWHAGPHQGLAPDALALMRSRYSAYVLGLTDYLQASWHASTRPAPSEPEPGLRWLGLQIKRHEVQDLTHATVEFVARSKLGGRAHRLHETSRFVSDGGRWYYMDGDLHAGG